MSFKGASLVKRIKHRVGIIRGQLRNYLTLIKSLQTGLLLVTGIAGYTSEHCPVRNIPTMLNLSGSLFLAISGSTVLNMVYDRDIDAKMQRTSHRPLPAGKISKREAIIFGGFISIVGVAWALVITPLYGLVVLGGLLTDVVVYTILLKRRTAWSILWGGIAGGMPALAGRALAVNRLDWIGIAMALAVLLWIPTHIMTIHLRHREDYHQAGIPTFPSTYGERITHMAIALSSILGAAAMAIAAVGLGMTWGYLRVMAILSAGLFTLAFACLIKPTAKRNFGLFKYASIYMLTSMLLVVVWAI
jgi:protoheme IX farnesyltransferase